MAIVWGSWSSNNRLRAGIEMTMSPSTVSASTASVTITTKVYLQTRYASYESGSGTTWWISGDLAASGNTDWNLGDMGTILMGQTSKTFSTSYTSSTKVSSTGKIHSYYAYAGTEATVSTSLTIPQRPIVAPSTPTGLTATRSSDTQQNLAWSRTSTSGAPVQYTDVQRSTDGGAYAQIATLGNVGSYSDTSTSANHKYLYRVRTRNSAGSSGWAYLGAGAISTTPAAPAAPTAAKTTSGDITVTRPALSSVATQWEVWHASGGVWETARIALLDAATTSWTHTAPSNSATHTYKIKAISSGPTLYSAFSPDSNTVQLLAAPNAPTSLSPSGTARDATEDATFSWQHNAVDTTAQTAYEIQYRPAGGTWTSTGKVSSTSSSRLFPAGTWTNGQTLEWQVRTWGSFTDPSPWSATGTVTLSARPTAAINAPDVTLSTSVIEVDWAYADDEGTAQAAYTVRLLDANGVPIEEISESGPTSTVTFTTRAVNGASYSVTVAVQDGSGLWSATTQQDFTVTFATPPAPNVTVEWQPDTGAVAVSIDTPGPSVDEVDATSVALYRGDGETWTVVASGLEIITTVLDPIPPLNATVLYKAVAISDLPSSTESAVQSVDTPALGVYVNGGPAFSMAVPLLVDPVVADTTARDREIVFFAGRRLPLEITGDALTSTYAVTAVLFDDGSTPSRKDLRDFVRTAGPACLRDPDGTRVFVSVGDASVSGAGAGGHRALSWSFTEIDWTETTV